MGAPTPVSMGKPFLHVGGTTETHRIACPYEPVGHADVDLQRIPGSAGARDGIQIDTKQELKCTACGRYFRLGTKVVLTGVPLDRPPEANVAMGPERKAG